MADPTKYYPFFYKDSSVYYKDIESGSYLKALEGDLLTGSEYPRTSSIDIKYFNSASADQAALNDKLIPFLTYTRSRKYIYALKNTLNSYAYSSNHYLYSSSLGDKNDQTIKLISIPSIIKGSAVEKGTVEIDFYVSGSLLAKLSDYKKNGELIEITGSNTGSVAGVILYQEGFILLTGSWNITTNFSESYYKPTAQIDYPKWIYWGSGLNESNNLTISSSFDLRFDTTNYINTLTMFMHAEKGELNHSNNPTSIDYNYNTSSYVVTGSKIYYEQKDRTIKNTVKYPYENFTGSLEKQTFINKIGIFDENRNLIAIAKLAKPVKKTEDRDITFKVKLDI